MTSTNNVYERDLAVRVPPDKFLDTLMTPREKARKRKCRPEAQRASRPSRCSPSFGARICCPAAACAFSGLQKLPGMQVGDTRSPADLQVL